MRLEKCPVCGRPAVTIDGVKTCLYCGREFKEQKPTVPPLAMTLKNNERITEQAHKNLLNNVDGSLDYCLKRGITMKTIADWRLGYVPDKYPLLPLMWWRRLLFPIISNDGKSVIAFGGRKIVADERAKYVNSRSSAAYSKSNSLYGYNLVPEDAEVVYLCEGYVDVLSMDAKGFAYPVASLGTALTTEQALLLRKKTRRIVICYDADDAGQKNALRAINLLFRAGFKTDEISVLVISDAKDVDEALQHGCTLCEQSLLGYLLDREQYDLFVDALTN